jgi:hypothetical protein
MKAHLLSERKVQHMMKMKRRRLLAALLLAVAMNVCLVSAQTTSPAPAVVSDPLAMLPASDVVVFANVRRILNDAIPRLLAKDPAMLTKLMAVANEAKTKTGINILAIDRLVMGARIVGPVGRNFKKESVGIAIIAHGDFNANALIDFAKGATHGKISEQAYNGKVIYSEPMPEPPRTRAERETPAFAVLDTNTLVVGDLPQVRATIDAMTGTGRVDPALVRHATQESDALVGMAIKFSPSLAGNAGGEGPDAMGRAAARFFMATFKELFASIGSTPTSFNMVLGLRLCDAEQAQSLSELLTSARNQFGGSGGDPHLRGLLNSVQVSAEGSELRVRADFKDEIVQNVISSMMKPRRAAGPEIIPEVQVAPAKKTPPQTRRRRRRG